jgi:hypothetical protein
MASLTTLQLNRVIDLVKKLNKIAEDKNNGNVSTAMLTIAPGAIKVHIFNHGRHASSDVAFVSLLGGDAFVQKTDRIDEDFTMCEEYLRGILEVVA